MIEIYQPFLPPDVLKYAYDAIASSWISSQGKYKELVEEKLKELLNVKYVLLLNSGTAAVHLMSRSLYKFYPGIKNIIVPNNVYVAAWNGFLFDNKYKLLSFDANIDTWNLNYNLVDPFDVEKNALLVVHNVSATVNVPELLRKYPQSIIMEDACEGFLGKYENKYVGTESLCSSISFFGNKSITCGEGGAIITNNKNVYDFSKKLHGQGQSNTRYIHDELGYNYRMTNVQAAILYGQLEYLDVIIEKKNWVFDSYRSILPTIPHVVLQKTDFDTTPSNWMCGVRIIGNKNGYSHVESYFRNNGVDVRPMFYPMSKHSYAPGIHYPDNEKVASILSKECFMIPSYPELTEENIETIYTTMKNYVKKYVDKK